MINRRSQIGSTLTWFTATVIIFFIMVLFLTVSILDSGRKKVTSGWDDVKLEEFSGNLESQRVLFNLLESSFEIENVSMKMKDWLTFDLYNMEASKKSLIRENIKLKIFELINANGDKDCYTFQAISGIEKDPKEILKTTDSRGSGYVSDFIEKSSIEMSSYYNPAVDLRGVRYANAAHEKLLNRATSIFLIRNTNVNVFGVKEDYQKVLIKFYIGEC
jgi:hypothetical protein